MKIKKELLKAFLDKYNISVELLAKDMGIAAAMLETLLNGEAVDRKVAERFIHYFGAEEAAKMIDWDAIGKVNPLDED